MDGYIKGAIGEYFESNRTVLEGLRDRGVLTQMDFEERLDRLRRNIEEDLDFNRAYGMLLMEMTINKHEVDDKDNYVSLTEIARLKNFENPSYVIQSWLRDRNTLDVLFLWELEHNPNFQSAGYSQIKRKLSDPSFTLTAKIWKEHTYATGIISKQGNGGGTFAHRDIAIDFYVWTFPEKRYKLIQLVAGKIDFLESLKNE